MMIIAEVENAIKVGDILQWGQFIVMIIGGMWGVIKLSNTMTANTEVMKAIKITQDEQKEELNKVQDVQHKHGEKIAVIGSIQNTHKGRLNKHDTRIGTLEQA